ncbi:hypothetical protein DL762_006851 [Monosporascus cannonballus]|uniref:MULE transposase domain-containing protein n=1 Tax=Monosporascus cannonballus TaxID=155416 RepID=A0ABY0H3Z0_9PEZI|nr:hypothetical protein DL762_006851 [Monosporascus cannonballus]
MAIILPLHHLDMAASHGAFTIDEYCSNHIPHRVSTDVPPPAEGIENPRDPTVVHGDAQRSNSRRRSGRCWTGPALLLLRAFKINTTTTLLNITTTTAAMPPNEAITVSDSSSESKDFEFSSDSEPEAHSSPRPRATTIPNPPDNHLGTFKQLDDLESVLRVFAKAQSFNFVRRGSANPTKGKNGDGLPTRVDLRCDQCHPPRTISMGLRRTESKEAATCPWKAMMIRNRGSNWEWFVRMYKDNEGQPLQHSHGPSQRSEIHAAHRQLGEDSYQQVEASIYDNASRPRELRRAIRKATGGRERPTLKDINNIRLKIRKRIRKGITATQAFIRRLRTKVYYFKIRWENDDPTTNRPIAFFWAMPCCTGQTASGSVFNRAFALIGLYEEPFRNAKLQICIFHINKNVIANVGRKWIKPPTSDDDEFSQPEGPPPVDGDNVHFDSTERSLLRRCNRFSRDWYPHEQLLDDIPLTKEGFLTLWSSMVYAGNEAQFADAWNTIVTRFGDTQNPAIRCLESTYVPCRDEWSCAWTIEKFNLGQLLEAQQEDVEMQVAEDTLKIRKNWIGREYLDNVPTQCSYKCLRLINAEYKYALSFIPTRTRPQVEKIPPCECETIGVRRHLGIPCYHEIYNNIRRTQEKPHIMGLRNKDIHRFWHLDRNLVEIDPGLAIRNPPTAIPKGRPASYPIVRLSEAITNIQRSRARESRPAGGPIFTPGNEGDSPAAKISRSAIGFNVRNLTDG